MLRSCEHLYSIETNDGETQQMTASDAGHTLGMRPLCASSYGGMRKMFLREETIAAAEITRPR